RSTHSQFAGRMGPGYDAIGGGTEDCNGHGTHVAGTVGGSTYGVATNVSLHPVRVLGCNGSGSTTGIINALNWIGQNATLPAVANMSLGGGASSALDQAVANLVNTGVTVVVAAGNSNANACGASPAREASAVTVGSTTSSDSRSSFSNFGTCVDVFAPGSSILSAWHTSNSASNTISGTSMASPHVAGVAAAYLQGNPGASPAQVAAALTSNGISNTLNNVGSGSPNLLVNTDFIGDGGGDPPPPPPPPPAGGCEDSCGGQSPDGCWCDDACVGYGDCCDNYEDECVAPPPDPNSCQDNNTCGSQAPGGCWCDNACVNYGDCCADGPC
ncbi:MAG: S8 family serine peptidase, partial [Pseudomonadota bacterium]